MTLTKNQKVLLGVGALAVAGYMIYRNSRKTTSFANFSNLTLAEPKDACKCSPADYEIRTSNKPGKPVAYECCGSGIYGYKLGPLVERSKCSAQCAGGVAAATLGV